MARPSVTTAAFGILVSGALTGCSTVDQPHAVSHADTHQLAHSGGGARAHLGHTAPHPRLWIKERPIVVVHFRHAQRVYYHYSVKNDLKANVHFRTDYKRRSVAARPLAKVVCGRHSVPCPK
jgi:hypothetical protein